MPLNKNTQRAILNALMMIPMGKVASYGLVAEVAGIKRGHRVVARFLREYQGAHKLPWQRVILASGKLAFDVGDPHHKKQKGLLAEEGVVTLAGRVNLKEYLWQPDLDSLLFRPDDWYSLDDD